MDSPPVKLEWMYKDASSNVDREEYLLGRSIDKTFERSEYGADYDLDKDGVPRSIFSTSHSSSQVDIQRKIQEDPLEAIRQKEIEMRKQLLKNPIKLRKLQNMLENQTKKKDAKKKSKKHKKKKSRSSDSNSEDEGKGKIDDLDKLLAAKYAKLVKALGKDKLSSLKSGSSNDSDSEEEAPQKTKKTKTKEKKRRESDSDDSSKKKKDKKKSRRSTSPESDRERDRKSRKRRDSSPDDSRKVKSRRSRSRDRSRRERSEERPGRRQDRDKQYGLTVTKSTQSARDRKSYSERKEDDKKSETKWKKPEKVKLTEEEIERRRKEMMDNARWRDDFRQKNVKRYKEEELEEKKKEKDYDSEFMLKQMSGVVKVHGSVEERIRSKINNIQRTKSALEKSFVKR